MDMTVLKFLRYYWRDLVEFAIDLAELDDKELEAVRLCGLRRLTIEKAAELSDPPVSVNTMQSRWMSARMRLCKIWCSIGWIKSLVDTMDD